MLCSTAAIMRTFLGVTVLLHKHAEVRIHYAYMHVTCKKIVRYILTSYLQRKKERKICDGIFKYIPIFTRVDFVVIYVCLYF